MMNEKKVVPIKYIGRNPTGFSDGTLYGTGTVWKHPGDVQVVCHTDSLKLLKHNDMFALLSEKDANMFMAKMKANSNPIEDAVRDVERAVLYEKEKKERDNSSKWDLSDALRAELDAITDKEALIEFASRQQETATRVFDRRKTVDNLKDEIIEIMTLSGTLL